MKKLYPLRILRILSLRLWLAPNIRSLTNKSNSSIDGNSHRDIVDTRSNLLLLEVVHQPLCECCETLEHLTGLK